MPFLVKRPNSGNWQLELRFPKNFVHCFSSYAQFRGRLHFTKGLGTPDRQKAEIIAAPYINKFRIAIYEWKHRPRPHPEQQAAFDEAFEAKDYETAFRILYDDRASPSTAYDGGRVRKFANGLQVINDLNAVVEDGLVTFYGSTGQRLRSDENPWVHVRTAPHVSDPHLARAFIEADSDVVLPSRFMPPKEDPDSRIIEAYIQERRLKPHIAAEARATLQLYQQVVGKPFSKSSRKDGKQLVQHLEKQKLARATIKKKVGWLSAACSCAIDDQVLLANPFTKVVSPPKKGDSARREAFTEKQIGALWSALPALSKSDQVLWKLLAKTGMRLGEALSIDREYEERGSGIRYVLVGTKTDSSERKIPLPLDIGLPDSIVGLLFKSGAPATSKRLNRFIKDTLDCEGGLVLHCLRHRMVEVLRLVLKADHYLSRRLIGHAAQDIHERYGNVGPPMSSLKPLIEGNAIDGTLSNVQLDTSLSRVLK